MDKSAEKDLYKKSFSIGPKERTGGTHLIFIFQEFTESYWIPYGMILAQTKFETNFGCFWKRSLIPTEGCLKTQLFADTVTENWLKNMATQKRM